MESPAVLRKCKYAFLTLPNYSLIAVANALEPLRMANRLVGQDVYEWSVISMDGRAANASSGLNLSPTGALDQLGPVDILFVCGGINVREAVSPALLTALDQHTLEERMVTRDEYLHFIELRKQVDELLASGRYTSVDAGLALKKN